MTNDAYTARRSRLARKLKAAEVNALLVTNFVNVRYLTGFSGDSSWLLLTRDAAVMLSDGRYTTQIEEECRGLDDVVIRNIDEKIHERAVPLIEKMKPGAVGFESDTTTHVLWEYLLTNLKSTELKPTSGMVEELRAVKDKSEIASIREAVVQAERGFAVIRESILPESTERELAHELEHAMRKFGAERAGFEPIVAVGSRSALPHARPGSTRAGDSGFILFDWGAETVDGYRCDLTRVLATGKISPKLEKVYRVVLSAHQRGIEEIRPGVKCDAVDAAARKVIEDAGYGKQFGHGLGHSFGLEIHEHPRFSSTSDDELKPGMVMTVEPGIYFPGWGGVRIEDDVLVTRDGCEVLTSTPLEWEEIVVPM